MARLGLISIVGIVLLILGAILATYGVTYEPFPPGFIPREKALIIPTADKLTPVDFNPIRYVPGCDPFMQEPLFVANALNGSLAGWLATKYEYNADYTQLKIYLRSNVKWSDGEPFTAKDLAFTLNTFITEPKLGLYGELSPVVDKSEATDDLTCTIYFKKSSPRFHLYFVVEFCQPRIIPIPEHIWKNVEDKFTYTNPDPVFTGPYKHVESREDIRILKRNEFYWGKKPEPEYVIIKYIPTREAAIEAAKRNEIDNFVSPGMASVLKSDFDEIKSANPNWIWPLLVPGFCGRGVYVNTRVYPLSLKEVRWAISLGIDRQKILDVLAYGIGRVAKSMFGEYGTLNEFVWKHTDILAKYDISEYNPAKARAILDDLNFVDRDGDGIRETPNGTKLSFDFMSFTWGKVKTELLVDFMKDIGIELSVRYADPLIWDALTLTGDFQMTWAWYCTGVLDPYQGFYGDYINSGTWDNDWWLRTWAPEEYKQLLDEYGTLDPFSLRAREISRRLLEIVQENLPCIPTFFEIEGNAFNNYYWTGWPTEADPYMSTCNWHQGRYTYIVTKLKSTGRLSPEAQEAVTRKNSIIAGGGILAVIGLVIAVIPMVTKKK